MMPVTQKDVLRAVSSKHGLEDPRFYVGRSREHLGCASLGSRASKVIWVSGPRRIGKTAFAQAVGRQFASDHIGAKVYSLDASGIASFDELLARLLKLAGIDDAGDPRGQFEAFADSTRRTSPVLLLIEELDRMAITLGVDEQGLLRRLTTDDRNLSYMLVSHTAPWRIVEDVSDESSRLLGVTQPIPLPVFVEREVQSLFQVVARGIGVEELSGVAALAWEQVGGHPLSVMTLLQKLTIAAVHDGERDLALVFDECRGELLRQMASLWRDLSPGTRAILLSDAAIKDDASRGNAKNEGFVTRRDAIIRPKLLMEAARTALAPSAPEIFAAEAAATYRLHDVICEINVCVETGGLGTRWFASTDEVRRQWRAARPCADEDSFRSVVLHLSKVVYEAAREPDPDRDPQGDPARWRIPDPYRKPFSTAAGVRALQVYRNYFAHDPDFGKENDDRPKRHEGVGKEFLRACGVTWPGTPAHWYRAHAMLLSELVSAVENLLAQLRRVRGA